jgi:hypothetical protein
MDIPLIEQVKIQAQVLVPLVKALQAELGEERANAIVRKALADLYRKYGERWWRAQGARDLGEEMASAFDMFARPEMPCNTRCRGKAHAHANHHARRQSLRFSIQAQVERRRRPMRVGIHFDCRREGVRPLPGTENHRVKGV